MIVIIGAFAFQVWAWRQLSRRVTSGMLPRARAVLRYIALALASPLLLVASFLGAVGSDEWIGTSLVGESMARTVLPLTILLLGLAGLGSIGFAIACTRLRTPSVARE